jgi:CMP-N-acetylneuraminic acid synthetase
MSILAIIPARSESKRLPKKNILPLCGKPLIHWTIEVASDCDRVSRVVVSTDGLDIAERSRIARSEVPFIRPYALATDKAATKDVVLHALEWFESQGMVFDYILLLQPTSPMRDSYHINQAIDLILETNVSSVVSVCEMEHSPLWSMQLDASGMLDVKSNEKYLNMRGQDLPVHYRLNGSIYLTKTAEFLKYEQFAIAESCLPYIMTANDSIDIDTFEDFQLAEYFMRKKLLSARANAVGNC